MNDSKLIQDSGLFAGQKIFEFSLADSFDEITNLFQTIKEYRSYSNPDEDKWFDYIHEFFQILGFKTNKLAPRLVALQDIGEKQSPKALVCIISPKEDFVQIIPSLSWESYLFFASKFYQVDWVILTNGLQFKVLNYAKDRDGQKYFMCELDEIIKNNITDSFFTLFKIFAVINKKFEQKQSDQKDPSSNTNEKGKRKYVERHVQRREFWTQLLERSKEKTQLFSTKKSPGVEGYLNTGAGKTGLLYGYNLTYEKASIYLYIDKGNFDWNKATFDNFLKDKAEIEGAFGGSLTWDRLDENRASLIRYQVSDYGLTEKARWSELQDQMIDAMIRFDQALKPFIQKMEKTLS